MAVEQVIIIGYLFNSMSQFHFILTRGIILQLGGALAGVLDLNDQLAGVNSVVQVDKGLLGLDQAAFDHSLVLLELALRDPLRKLGTGLGEVLGVVQDDEALHLDAHDDNLSEVSGADGLRAVVLANKTTLDEASMLLGTGKGQLKNLTTN